MKKFVIIFLLLLFPFAVHAAEPAEPEAAAEQESVAAAPESPDATAENEEKPADETSSDENADISAETAQEAPVTEPADEEESEAENKLTLPPDIAAGKSFTPKQLKTFLAKEEEESYIVLNFDNASLRDVINTISSITGESFILSPGIDARITIYSSGRIPSSEVLSVFESVLEVNNIALVRSGRFYKIVPGPGAKQKPIEVQLGRKEEDVLPIDRPVTQIVPIEYVPAVEISTVLQPMLSKIGSIIPNPRNNLLIINDSASNIKRLLKILEQVDVNAFKNTRMGFFQPKFSDVKSLSQEIKDILNGLNLGQHGIAIIPIERINSLIVFSSSPSLLKIVEGWIKKLDEEITTGQNIYVYPLQNVKVDSIVNVIKTIYETDEGVQTRTSTTTAVAVKTPAAGAKAQKPPAVRRVTTTGEQAVQSRIEIVAFEPTNSLVILAPPGIYKDITDTIKKLDVYPQEVLIEAIIVEVTLTDSDQYGIQWSVLQDIIIDSKIIGNAPEFTGLLQNTASLTGTPNLGTTTPTLGAGSSGGLSFWVFQANKLTALVHAISSRGKVNILSSPRLLVRDQEEANIEVGSDIPTATSTTSTTTTDTLTQNIEYRTVGIKLKITPTINDEKTVVLDLEQEVSDQGPNITVGQENFSFPSFTTTKTNTSIIVPDNQSIVIGGIMEEKKNKDHQGIPLLSSIPLLGNLFRYTVNSSSKKELIIMLTPHVISNRDEADVLTLNFLKRLDIAKKYLEDIEDQLELPVAEEINSTQTNEQ